MPTPLPKKYSSYTPIAAASLTGSEVIPVVQSGVNGTTLLSSIPTPAATVTKLAGKMGKAFITIGRTGSGADYECDGIADDVQINAAIVQAVATPNVGAIWLEGYGYDFQYSLSASITLKPIANGNEMVSIYGNNTIIKMANGSNCDGFITENFYSEINTNFNSYSHIGPGKIAGLTIEGNSSGNAMKTILYSTLSAFPATGLTGNIYVARDTDIGYTWNGTAYVTTAIADSGKHWRAYALHLIKIYAYNYILEDLYLRDATEFALYSEQTNSDTTVFNNYSTMEATVRRCHIVGYQLGGINWLGPHDSHWQDVKVHTNQYGAATSWYNIYVGNGNNFNGGGLVWDDVHPWGATATFGYNVWLENTSVYGTAYIEGSPNIGLFAYNSSIQINLNTTNNSIANVVLQNCYNSVLDIKNYYQFNPLVLLVKLVGTLTNSQIYVRNIDPNNVSGTPKVFDVSGLTGASNNLIWARLNNITGLSVGMTAASLDASNEIDIVQAGSTVAATTVIKRIKASSPSVSIKTANYTLTGVDDTVVFDATAGSLTATLPDASTYYGGSLLIKRLDATYASGNTVSIATVSSQTIDGASSYTLTTNSSGVRVASNGTNWIIVGKI